MRARGQATTELALASVVFVTILLFGLFFGELPVLMLKVKEAARFAAFETAQERHHQFSVANVNAGSASLGAQPRTRAQAEAQRRFQDFDGARSTGSLDLTLTMTQASGSQTRCVDDGALQFRYQGGGNAGAYLRGLLDDTEGGVRCQSQARASPIRIGRFLDQGDRGLSQEEHWASRYTAIVVCGAGRARDNACTGRGLRVLGGDWAFDGPAGSPLNGDVNFFTTDDEHQADNDVENLAYARLAQRVFDEGPGKGRRAGSEFLRKVAGIPQNDPRAIDETAFSMSYRGIESRRVAPRKPRSADPTLHYPTVGADMPHQHSRSGDPSLIDWDERTGEVDRFPRCFLGLEGCGRP